MEPAAALFANDLFYLAFSHRDLDSMEQLWAREHSVICIHPGWSALTDRAEVLKSWHGILQSPHTGVVTPHHAQVFDYGQFTAVVCYEEVQSQMLVATNVFVTESDNVVRMVLHQASTCMNPPAPESKVSPALQ